MKRLVLLLLICLAPVLFACATRGTCPATHTTVSRYGFSPGNGRFFYTAGTAGTVTVGAGSFVTGLSAHAASTGATLTMTPSGPDVTVPVTGPAIPIPAGGALSLSRPLLIGQADELGTGSILVFAGTDSYIVTFFQGGGS